MKPVFGGTRMTRVPLFMTIKNERPPGKQGAFLGEGKIAPSNIKGKILAILFQKLWKPYLVIILFFDKKIAEKLAQCNTFFAKKCDLSKM